MYELWPLFPSEIADLSDFCTIEWRYKNTCKNQKQHKSVEIVNSISDFNPHTCALCVIFYWAKIYIELILGASFSCMEIELDYCHPMYDYVT